MSIRSLRAASKRSHQRPTCASKRRGQIFWMSGNKLCLPVLHFLELASGQAVRLRFALCFTPLAYPAPRALSGKNYRSRNFARKSSTSPVLGRV